MERVRQAAPPPNAIMMLSSTGLHGDAARCRRLGFRYLTKPVPPCELQNGLRECLAGGQMPPTESWERRPSAPATHSRPLRVLLAEDNAVNRQLAVRLLEKNGHSVVPVGDGRAALLALDTQAFDVVLMDVQMPVMDGLEATRAIRRKEAETGAHTVILALTAHALPSDRTRCLEAGMDGYVSKPLRPKELLEAIGQAVSAASP
jgi:CheY-like chemotaxis protein